MLIAIKLKNKNTVQLSLIESNKLPAQACYGTI
jgi:hypothetical protein